eukprot:8433449-Ditylum_brightwellii.AAC.1
MIVRRALVLVFLAMAEVLPRQGVVLVEAVSSHGCKTSTGPHVSIGKRSTTETDSGSSGNIYDPQKYVFVCDTSAGSCGSEIHRSATKMSTGSGGSIVIVGGGSGGNIYHKMNCVHNNQKQKM